MDIKKNTGINPQNVFSIDFDSNHEAREAESRLITRKKKKETYFPKRKDYQVVYFEFANSVVPTFHKWSKCKLDLSRCQ